MITAKTIRLFSVFGIILLLILQYIWFKNSYVLMEHDIIEKSELNLLNVVENELFERLKKLSINISVQKNEPSKRNSKNISKWNVDKTNDLNSGLQELTNILKNPCSLPRVDTLFREKMIESIGFSPSHTIRFINDTQKSKAKPSKFTIYAKVTQKQYIEVTLNSPLGSILRQAQFIMFISILLVFMIGVILIYQLKSMLRENKFVSFIRDYTHALTHELKTPISGIYMSASQLASGKLEERPESRKHHYQMCKDQSLKLLTTVDRILLVAKAEHSKIEPNSVYTEVKPFVDKIAENHRLNNFRMKDIEITTGYEAENLMGFFDPFLLENVLNNLIDNAVKYSESSVKISITCSIVENHLLIAVKDNGFGIAEKELKHIFDNFERGNKVEGKGIDGYGIGLNYVNKVIKAHKGKITVISKEGKGSEFRIILPVKK